MAVSLKRLRQFWPDETARQIRGLITGQINPENYASVQNWVGQCFNRPSSAELVLEALNEVMGGFGVEAIRGRWVDSYHCDIQAVYVNMGDTYDITIFLDHETGNYVLTSYGDWIERNEKRRELT